MVMNWRNIPYFLALALVFLSFSNSELIQLKKSLYKDENCQQYRFVPTTNQNLEAKYKVKQFVIGKCSLLQAPKHQSTIYNVTRNSNSQEGTEVTVYLYNDQECKDLVKTRKFIIGACFQDEDEQNSYVRYEIFNTDDSPQYFYYIRPCWSNQCNPRRPVMYNQGTAVLQDACYGIEEQDFRSVIHRTNETHRVVSWYKKNSECKGEPEFVNVFPRCWIRWDMAIFDFRNNFFWDHDPRSNTILAPTVNGKRN